jgi:hypothetical protein
VTFQDWRALDGCDGDEHMEILSRNQVEEGLLTDEATVHVHCADR